MAVDARPKHRLIPDNVGQSGGIDHQGYHPQAVHAVKLLWFQGYKPIRISKLPNMPHDRTIKKWITDYGWHEELLEMQAVTFEEIKSKAVTEFMDSIMEILEITKIIRGKILFLVKTTSLNPQELDKVASATERLVRTERNLLSPVGSDKVKANPQQYFNNIETMLLQVGDLQAEEDEKKLVNVTPFPVEATNTVGDSNEHKS